MRTANGWKRLWLVLSVLGLLYAAVINPQIVGKDIAAIRYPSIAAAERELSNPECQPYSAKPFAELAQPKYVDEYGSEGCYNLYSYRKYFNQTKVPLTAEDIDREFSDQIGDEMLSWAGAGFVASIMLSALVYFLGVVVAWVVSGFRARPS